MKTLPHCYCPHIFLFAIQHEISWSGLSKLLCYSIQFYATQRKLFEAAR